MELQQSIVRPNQKFHNIENEKKKKMSTSCLSLNNQLENKQTIIQFGPFYLFSFFFFSQLMIIEENQYGTNQDLPISDQSPHLPHQKKRAQKSKPRKFTFFNQPQIGSKNPNFAVAGGERVVVSRRRTDYFFSRVIRRDFLAPE